MEGEGGSLILTLNRRGGFPNLKRRDGFPNSFHDKRGSYSNPDEFRISSLDRNLDIEPSLLWIDEVDKLLDVMCIPTEDHVKFVAYKLKRRAAACWNQLQHIRMLQGKPPIRTWRKMR